MADKTETRSDVFIIGAGFSKAVNDCMPVLSSLAEPVKARLLKAQPGISAIPFIDENVELALSYLLHSHAWIATPEHLRNRALGLELATAIADEIRSREAVALEKFPETHEWAIRLAHWMHRHRSAVITFNYDTIIERCFQHVFLDEGANSVGAHDLIPISFATDGRWSLRGSPRSTAALLKLHGSLDWYYSGRSSYFGELISRNPRGRVPLIVPPAADKSGYFEHEDMRYLWSEAKRYISNAERLFFVGYSLPETDLPVRFMLQASVRDGQPSIWVIDRNPDIVNHHAEMLGRDAATLRTFSGDRAVEEFVATLITSDVHMDRASATTGQRGPVERAFRSSLSIGDLIGADSVQGPYFNGHDFAEMRVADFDEAFNNRRRAISCRVITVDDKGFTIEIGEAAMPVFIDWETAEEIVPFVRNAPEGVLDVNREFGQYRCLHHLLSDKTHFCVSPSLIALLTRTGVLEPYYHVNTWRLRLGACVR